MAQSNQDVLHKMSIGVNNASNHDDSENMDKLQSKHASKDANDGRLHLNYKANRFETARPFASVGRLGGVSRLNMLTTFSNQKAPGGKK